MMNLEFDARQLLMPGVHDVVIETVKEHFSKFQRSDRRLTLYSRLVEYIDALKREEFTGSVIIDGSFVMACVDEPGDIDILLVFPVEWDIGANLKPFQYSLVSKRSVKRRYAMDLFLAVAGSP